MADVDTSLSLFQALFPIAAISQSPFLECCWAGLLTHLGTTSVQLLLSEPVNPPSSLVPRGNHFLFEDH